MTIDTLNSEITHSNLIIITKHSILIIITPKLNQTHCIYVFYLRYIHYYDIQSLLYSTITIYSLLHSKIHNTTHLNIHNTLPIIHILAYISTTMYSTIIQPIHTEYTQEYNRIYLINTNYTLRHIRNLSE